MSSLSQASGLSEGRIAFEELVNEESVEGSLIEMCRH